MRGTPRGTRTSAGSGRDGAALLPAIDELGSRGITLVATSGVLYTIGGLIYLFQRPNPLPRWFGFHEVFHALVVAAATCHFLAVWPLVTGPLGAA